MSTALGLGESAERGRNAAFDAMAGRTAGSGSTKDESASTLPGWARAMKAQQSARHHGQTAMRTLEQGDRGGHGATPDIKERDD
jgi:type IV secretion system protein TrbL